MSCSLEWDEWQMVDALVAPHDAVLELGARFGTTSCRLARATRNSGRVVSVEPVKQVWADLGRNREANACNFHIVRGTVSDKPLALGWASNYGQRTRMTDSSFPALPNHGLAELEALTGRRFNVALIDCEGCIGALFAIPGVAAQLELVLLEEDMYTRGQADNRDSWVDYDSWYAQLRAAGFTQIWRSHDTSAAVPAGLPDDQSAGDRLYHSAWAKGKRAAWGDMCAHHAHVTGLPRRQLDCAPIPDASAPRERHPCKARKCEARVPQR